MSIEQHGRSSGKMCGADKMFRETFIDIRFSGLYPPNFLKKIIKSRYIHVELDACVSLIINIT